MPGAAEEAAKSSACNGASRARTLEPSGCSEVLMPSAGAAGFTGSGRTRGVARAARFAGTPLAGGDANATVNTGRAAGGASLGAAATPLPRAAAGFIALVVHAVRGCEPLTKRFKRGAAQNAQDAAKPRHTSRLKRTRTHFTCSTSVLRHLPVSPDSRSAASREERSCTAPAAFLLCLSAPLHSPNGAPRARARHH